jgi:hypothetical protein
VISGDNCSAPSAACRGWAASRPHVSSSIDARAIDRSRQSLRELQPRFAATLNFANWADEVALVRLLASDALGHATTVHPFLGNIDRLGLLRGGLANVSEAALQPHRGAMNERCVAAVVSAFGDDSPMQLRDLPRRTLASLGARYEWTVFTHDSRALAQLATHADM